MMPAARRITLTPGSASVSTVAQTLQSGASLLDSHSDSPRLDAELLLGKILGCPRSGLIARGNDPVASECARGYANLIEERLRGAPVAYLTGTREFWSLALRVTPAVLVPRPETELLVELALQHLPGHQASPSADRACSILDLGTGSGAIALAVASERPGARVHGRRYLAVGARGRHSELARPRTCARRLAPGILVRAGARRTIRRDRCQPALRRRS